MQTQNSLLWLFFLTVSPLSVSISIPLCKGSSFFCFVFVSSIVAYLNVVAARESVLGLKKKIIIQNCWVNSSNSIEVVLEYFVYSSFLKQ